MDCFWEVPVAEGGTKSNAFLNYVLKIITIPITNFDCDNI